MSVSLDPAQFQGIWSAAQAYFSQQVLSWAMLAQIAVAGGALLLAYKVTKAIRTWITRQQAKCTPLQEICRDLTRLTTFSYVIGPALALLFLWIPYRVAEHFNLPRDGLYTIVICLLALVLIRFLTGQMQNRVLGHHYNDILLVPGLPLHLPSQ